MHSTNSYHMPTKCQALCQGWGVDDEQDKVGAYEHELTCASVQRKGFGRRHAPTKLRVIAGEADGSGRGHRTGGGGEGWF